jgi:3-oxoacyl-[acyl-carrier-protein] synthase-3
MKQVKITGVGSYIPEIVKKNSDFLENDFYNEDRTAYAQNNDIIIEKFKAITGIEERRYVSDDMNVSDIALLASEKAIEDAAIDKNDLDYIIIAHNFGDVRSDRQQTDILPSIGSRVKNRLKITNPNCVAYDMIFGCPGWIESCIQAKAFIQSGIAKKCLVVGSETLSRVVDPHDRDSMIYSDGAGATILEPVDDDGGILAHQSATYAQNEAYYIYFGESFLPERETNNGYIKMHGRKIYNFALSHVPQAMNECLAKSGKTIDDIKKIFIHQANEKMDEAIIERFYKMNDRQAPETIMPMSIKTLGNSSVATIPTLYDLFLQGEFDHDELQKGDTIMFASVGAGMNINAIVYQI